MRFTKSNIIPSEFRYLISYDMGGMDPGERPYGIVEAGAMMDECAVENFRDLGQCCICGTHFRWGDVWVHTPTNTRITLGWKCAERYGLMASRSDFENKRAAQIRKIELKEKRDAAAREAIAFLTRNPEVRVYLSCDHNITRDIKAKLFQWGSISPKQVALLKKLYDDAQIEQVEFPAMEMPEMDGRTEVEGTVLGVKWVEGYGYNTEVCKMLVAIGDENGAFKVYGTMPEAMSEAIMELGKKDDEYEGLKAIIRRVRPRVRFTAAFETSRDDKCFGFFKRPTKVAVLTEVTA